MPWDPLNAWPAGRRWLWIALAGLVCSLQGPAFIRDLRPARDRGVDFFQDWASARNLLNGLSIYTSHNVTVERYLGYRVNSADPQIKVEIDRNAHPPTSVLLALPLAGLDYPEAVLVWNMVSIAAFLVSLWLVCSQLRISWARWSVFPFVTLLLTCNPFRQQIDLGQLNLVVLLLLTGVWAADRSNRSDLAGILLGAATAVKLFPGFVFLYFLIRRQCRVVAAGLISLAMISGLTAAVLGLESYQTYFEEVLPQLQTFRSKWGNASLVGFWTKLFDPAAEQHVRPLWDSPALAMAAILCSALVLVCMLVWAVAMARTRMQLDRAFALTLTAMLLVSPTTWDHYLVLLLLPLMLVWLELPPSVMARVFFMAVFVALWLEPRLLYNAFIPGGYSTGIATPVHTVAILSFQFYALLGLFALGILETRREIADRRDPESANFKCDVVKTVD
jgi:hypothetical protein